MILNTTELFFWENSYILPSIPVILISLYDLIDATYFLLTSSVWYFPQKEAQRTQFSSRLAAEIS